MWLLLSNLKINDNDNNNNDNDNDNDNNNNILSGSTRRTFEIF